MPKRKSEDSDKRRKKLRKLERRLERYRKKEDASKNKQDETEQPQEDIDPEVLPEQTEQIPQPEAISQQENLQPEEIPAPSDNLEQLPVDILEALGEVSTSAKEYGDPIHKNIFECFENILINGIPKEDKEKLLKNIKIPVNCKLLEAPKLNLEVSGLLTTAARSRDNLMVERQDESGIAIAGICKAIDDLSKTEFDKVNLIRLLSNSTRLLCNLHYTYTLIRRKLVEPIMNKNLCTNLKENKRSDFLYSKLDDEIKSLTAMKRVTNVLNTKKQKNWQPPRQQLQPQRGRQRGGYSGYYPQPPRPTLPPHQVRRPAPTSSVPAQRGRARYP